MKLKKRIDFIDYLKAFCVLLVIVTHYEWADKDGFLFAFIINMAVPVFMILTGYNFSMSEQKKTGGDLRKMYAFARIMPQVKRFVMPFLAIGLVELFIIIYEGKNVNLPRLFLLGGYGPGSYYVPVMLQILLIFPLIYKLVEKNALLGIGVAGGVNLLFEIAVVLFHISRYDYRLLAPRYFLLVALGSYIYLHPEKRVKVWQMLLMLAVGIPFLVLVVMQNRPTSLFAFWSTTALPVALYIFPIVILLYRGLYNWHIKGIVGDLLSEIGKASYHIFLVQMVYYHFELGGPVMNMHWAIALPYNMFLTITAGILFYRAETKLPQLKNMLQKRRPSVA